MTQDVLVKLFATLVLGGALVGGCGDDGAAAPDAATQEDAPTLLPLGTACDVGTGCASGNCVDGVCCDSACAGTCEACGAEGACQPVAAGQDPAEECATDTCAPGSCDGAGACTISAVGTECRAAEGACDIAEACDGISPTCPTDAIAAEATSCRPEAGACDLEEACDGSSKDCPVDGFAGATTTCGGFLCTGAAAACPVTCTTDDECGPDFVCATGNTCVAGRRAFITSTTTTGAIGGLAGADQICQNLANASPLLRGTYRAWLSDATGSPATRFTQSTVPYYLPNGLALANSWADVVDGSIARSFNISDLGVAVGDNTPFTNTEAAGTAIVATSGAANCSNWSSAGVVEGSWVGYSATTDLGWTKNANVGTFTRCSVLHRLYCFQQ